MIYGEITVPVDPDAGIRNRCIEMVRKGAARIDRGESEHIADYNWWWNRGSNWTVEDMQKQCDMFFNEKRTLLDADGQPFETNLLTMLFNDAAKNYTYIKNRKPTAFFEARTLYTGEQTPFGAVYTEFWTPPWFFSMEPSGRVVIDPRGEIVNWTSPPESNP